ncbi:MAG: Ig-like domain-containing protein [Anaerolineaceae bacterium]|nr:Ig-like domain-containing protein [Anaerolineaceae bacterium]
MFKKLGVLVFLAIFICWGWLWGIKPAEAATEGKALAQGGIFNATVDINYDEGTSGWGVTAFKDIQTAINSVSAGAEIKVLEGTYHFTTLVIDKPLYLLGLGNPSPILKGKIFLKGQPDLNGLIRISNFTLTDTEQPLTIGDSATAKFGEIELLKLNIGTSGQAVTTAIQTYQHSADIQIKSILVKESEIYAAHGTHLSGDLGSVQVMANEFHLAEADGLYDAIRISQAKTALSSVAPSGQLQVMENNLHAPSSDTAKIRSAILNQAIGELAGNPGGKTLVINQNKLNAISDQSQFIQDDIASPNQVGPVKNETLGTNYFTIQAAIDAASAGHSILVGEGTYKENVVVDKTLTIRGAGQDKVTIYPALNGPKVCEGSSLCAGTSNIILVEADNVNISGLKLDGDNPALTDGVLINGVDVNARNGIITNHLKGNYSGLEVFQTTVQNVYLRGVYASTGSFHFHHNTVINVDGDTNSIGLMGFYGPGKFNDNTVRLTNNAIVSNWSKGTAFLDNTISQSGTGIHSDNGGDGVAVSDLIMGNTISDCKEEGTGIFTFMAYQPVTVKNNVVTGCQTAYAIWAQRSPEPAIFEGNTAEAPGEPSGSIGFYATTSSGYWGYYDVNFEFRENSLYGFEKAVAISADPEPADENSYQAKTLKAKIFNNSLEGNTSAISVGQQGQYEVNASGNWFGVDSVEGIKPIVDSRADFSPWLLSGTDTEAEKIGFQGDFSTLRVDDDSPQLGAEGRIQEAVNLVSGSKVYLNPGTYPENVMVNKYVQMIGAGSADDPAHNSLVVSPSTFDGALGIFNLAASGNSTEDPLLLQNMRLLPKGQAGISVGRFSGTTGTNVSYLKLENLQVIGNNNTQSTEQERGLYVDKTSSLDYAEVKDCAFNNLAYGFYFHKLVSAETSTVSDLAVSHTSFNHNDLKGIYAEKLKNATFSDIMVNGNGYRAEGVPSYFLPWLCGVDINLKAGAYQNIQFIRPLITHNGLGGAKEGVGIAIKARDDGTTYEAYPASLTGVKIEGGQVTGNERGIRLGEPGMNNAGPSNVTIQANRIYGNIKQYAGSDGSLYGGVINMSKAEVDAKHNWFGCNEGPGSTGNGCDAAGTASSGALLSDPWLVLSAAASPNKIEPGQTAVLMASVIVNSAGSTPFTDRFIPDGPLVPFTASTGTLAASTAELKNGFVEISFTAGNSEDHPQVCASLDAETSCSSLEVLVGELAAEDFSYWANENLGLRGVSAGFQLSYATLSGASVKVELFAGEQLLQTNNLVAGKLDGVAQFSTPFDIYGNFDYAADGYWTNQRATDFDPELIPTKVVARVTLANGKVLTAEKTPLSGDRALIVDTLDKEIQSAISYVYDDYQYHGKFAFDPESTAFNSTYTAPQFVKKALVYDLARYLGALYRQQGSTVRTLNYKGQPYTWNETNGLLGSNWMNGQVTLISVIANDYKDQTESGSITLTVKDRYHQRELHFNYLVLNTLDAEIASAPEYVYADGYQYIGVRSFEDATNTYALIYKDIEFEPAAMNDLARYLGALYRQEGSTVSSIAYGGKRYTWDDALPQKGSRWVDSEGVTLISKIVADFQTGAVNIQSGLLLTLHDGLHTENLIFQYTIQDTIAPKILSLKAVGAAGFEDKLADGLSFTVDQGYKVQEIIVTMSEAVLVKPGTVVSMGGAHYGAIAAEEALLRITPKAGNETAALLGTFEFSVPENSITDHRENPLESLRVQLVVQNVLPVAGEDSYATDEDSLLEVAKPGVLENDHDFSGLKAVLASEPSHGVLNLMENGSFSYEPEKDYFGTDSFVYKAYDGNGYSEETMVTLVVNPVNDAPVAEDAAFNLVQNGNLRGKVRASDVDDDASSLVFLIEQEPENGYLSLNANGAFFYAPDTGYKGEDAFSFKVKDPAGVFSVGTVVLNVAGQNRAPVLKAIAPQDVEEQATLRLVLEASDPDGDSLVYSMFNAPGGAAIDEASASFTWMPDENQGGRETSLLICVSDGKLTACQTMRIRIIETNQAPVFGTVSELLAEVGQLFAFTVPVSDPDLPAQAIHLSVETGMPEGMTFNAYAGKFNWTPTELDAGSLHSVELKACDEGGACTLKTLQIRVSDAQAPNPEPGRYKIYLPLVNR